MSSNAFPFKSGVLYKVKKDFHFPSGDAFIKDDLLFYVCSDYNHYDGIEIYFFRDKLSTKLLRWEIRDEELDSWKDYMEAVA
ncbi:MAG: hypothetical protein K2X86_15815 [Cytophagaceae bacterium]|nr:hypothetical protein [Cytophagaceae bacterium]